MKYSLNILKFVVCIGILFNAPLLTYASSCKKNDCSSKKCSRSHSHKKCKKESKKGKHANKCDVDVALKNKPRFKFKQDIPVNININQTDSVVDTQLAIQTQALLQLVAQLVSNQGCNCINGTSFITSFTSWFNNDQDVQTIAASIPFNSVNFATLGEASDQTAVNRIEHIPGTSDFTFFNSGNGTYLIDYGVLAVPNENTEFFFGWQRDNDENLIIQGSILETQGLPLILSTNAFTVKVENEHVLELVYLGSNPGGVPVTIGKSPTTGANYLYVTITQLN